MNILFYMTRYPGWGGIENVTSLIVSELSKTENVFILSHLQQKGQIYHSRILHYMKCPIKING